MKIVKRSKFTLTIICIALIIMVIWMVWANTALEVNEFTIKSEQIPESFSGFRIAQISDLHNDLFGEDNEILLSMLRGCRPDIIVLTGDLIDSYDTDIEVSRRFAIDALKIAPCYYVTGNHESRIPEFAILKADLEAAGVIILENERVELQRGGETIALIGIDDPCFQTAGITEVLHGLVAEDSYTILLSHRPELLDIYAQYSINLALTGHAHGGQFRLPFVGGVIAPAQGFFPKYDSGLYTKNTTNMLVSRGVGNSLIPMRFNNRPEIIVVELQPK
jgi:predicted MPP superfamily phosphohydrolase